MQHKLLTILMVLLPLLAAAQQCAELRRDTVTSEWKPASICPPTTDRREWEESALYHLESFLLDSSRICSPVRYDYEQFRTCRISGAVESRFVFVRVERREQPARPVAHPILFTREND